MITNFTPFPHLETPRLVLRALLPDDALEVFRLRSEPDVLRYIGRAPAQSLTDAQEFIAMIDRIQHNGEGITWAMVPKNAGPQLAGTICYWNLVPEQHQAEIGYVLLPEYHGQGLMQEAAAAVLAYGFGDMQIRTVEAYTHLENTPSIKLLERNGFTRQPERADGNAEYGVFVKSSL